VRRIQKFVNRIRKLLKNAMLRAASYLYRVSKMSGCYTCPICDYYGKFRSEMVETGTRDNAQCPMCGSLERHRIQYLVFAHISSNIDTKRLSMLHFAPEAFFRDLFKSRFGVYVSADLASPNADRREDMTKMSFADESFDFFFASQVLEHIADDRAALSEIRRILKPGGIAMIAVPIVAETTVEYGKPNPHEYEHVRRPGKDYYDRYREFFTEVTVYQSGDFDERYQLFACKRPGDSGQAQRLAETVPVCRK
jgi:SAM-dependent methyltransferase